MHLIKYLYHISNNILIYKRQENHSSFAYKMIQSRYGDTGLECSIDLAS